VDKFSVCVHFICLVQRMRRVFVESCYCKRTTFPGYSSFTSFILQTRIVDK
jgi:hypothetical protein